MPFLMKLQKKKKKILNLLNDMHITVKAESGVVRVKRCKKEWNTMEWRVFENVTLAQTLISQSSFPVINW